MKIVLVQQCLVNIRKIDHIKEYKYKDYICPEYSKLPKDGEPEYCWHCGQALDWSWRK